VCIPRSIATRPWNLRERLDERDITGLIIAITTAPLPHPMT
jgi:hypothetical protein